MPMNDAQLLRYSRQIFLPDFDIAGPERLRAYSGLGSPVALYLAAAGVGRWRLDASTMDWRTLRLPVDPVCPVCSGRT